MARYNNNKKNHKKRNPVYGSFSKTRERTKETSPHFTGRINVLDEEALLDLINDGHIRVNIWKREDEETGDIYYSMGFLRPESDYDNNNNSRRSKSGRGVSKKGRKFNEVSDDEDDDDELPF